MAMKIPSANNPFEVGVATYPVEGLVTPKADVSHAKAKFSAFQEQVDKWNAEQDAMAANDLINELEKESESMKNDPNEGWANQMGKNAVQRESGKSLADEQIERFKTKYHGMNLGMYSPAVRKKVQAYYDTKVNYINRDVNRHVIRQNEVWRESVDEENFRNLTKQALSQDPEEARSGFAGIRVLTDQRAARAGVKADYTKTLGPVLGMRITDALEAKNFAEAEQILAASEEFMDPMQFRKFGRTVAKAKESGLREMAVAGLSIKLEHDLSETEQAKTVWKEMTGTDLDEKEFQAALEDADGDYGRAIQVIGGKHYEKEGKGLAPEEAFNRAISLNKTLKARIEQASNMSTDDVLSIIANKYPDMPVEDQLRAARKFVVNRTMMQKQKQAERDKQALVALRSIQNGAAFTDIPESGVSQLDFATRKSLEEFSHRQVAGTLQNNPSIVYDLVTNPKKLATLSQEELISYAKDMTPETFEKLWTAREEILAGKRPKDAKFQMGSMIKEAMTHHALVRGGDATEKQMAGLMFDVIEDLLEYESHMLGKQMTQEEVTKRVGEISAASFVLPDDGFLGFKDSNTYTWGQVLKGGSMEARKDIDAFIDSGLAAQGIYSPTDVNRTRTMGLMVLMPDRPIIGADRMVEHLKNKNEELYKATMKDLENRGIKNPDVNMVVQCAFRRMINNQ